MSAALPTPTSLQALARRLQGDVRGGHSATTIARLATLDGAEPGDISFLSAARFREAARFAADEGGHIHADGCYLVSEFLQVHVRVLCGSAATPCLQCPPA